MSKFPHNNYKHMPKRNNKEKELKNFEKLGGINDIFY